MDEIDGIILSEINQTEKDKYVWYHLYVELKKNNKLVARSKNKQTQRYREQTSSYQWGEAGEEGQNRGKRLRSTN